MRLPLPLLLVPPGLLLALACAGEAPAPGASRVPEASPAPAASQGSGEIALGGVSLAWDEVQEKEGRWVRWKPCAAKPISVVIDPSARKVAYDVGQEVIEYTLTSGLLVDDTVTLQVSLGGAPSVMTIRTDGTGRAVITDANGARTFAPRTARSSYPELAETPCG